MTPSVFPLVPCTSNATTSQVTFGCFVTGYLPEPVTVKWNSGSVSMGVKTFPAVMSSSGIYSLSSQISVKSSSWEATTYYCDVQHQPTDTRISKQIPSRNDMIQPSWRSSPTPPRCMSTTPPAAPSHSQPPSTLLSPKETSSSCGIQVFLMPPSPAALYVDMNPKLTCLVVNMHGDKDLQVVWSRKKPGPINLEPIEMIAQFNGTYTASISLPILSHDWENGEIFTCKVEHSKLPAPIIRTITKKPGKRSAPVVYLLRSHRDELTSSGNTISLTCLVQGFFPADISVQWKRNNKADRSLEYITTSPMKDGGGESTFFLYSKLKVSKEIWNRGDSYTCMVIHETLPNKQIQKSVNKDSGN
uniref:Ig-like domain-containing protein n=1 Tax=Pelusios castaneus TaxID=367368 RepID=A0A8C8S3A7_9SAUR